MAAQLEARDGDLPPPHPTVKIALVITSISSPNGAMQELAAGSRSHGWQMIVVGDRKSPADFRLAGCSFLSLEEQIASPFDYAKRCPTDHYCRKNIGYLTAAAGGAERIVETDDDNFPRPAFFELPQRRQRIATVAETGWVNVYRFFSDALSWPRGLPLDAVRRALPSYDELSVEAVDCPVQQGLADANPDVDAVYRLTAMLPLHFRQGRTLALTAGAWCPFNSQNTWWWRDAFPLLYLPATCSFRMTDIWRSLVAQRVAWEAGWRILFRSPTVWQERNEHDLMRDFEDEIPGYLHNREVADRLAALELNPGVAAISSNLRRCYELLRGMQLVTAVELELLDSWLRDLHGISAAG